jgi:hypothetical protein
MLRGKGLVFCSQKKGDVEGQGSNTQKEEMQEARVLCFVVWKKEMWRGEGRALR